MVASEVHAPQKVSLAKLIPELSLQMAGVVSDVTSGALKHKQKCIKH